MGGKLVDERVKSDRLQKSRPAALSAFSPGIRIDSVVDAAVFSIWFFCPGTYLLGMNEWR
jgi:hypothetical protein